MSVADKESINRVLEIYNEWFDMVDYFVLLPYAAQGRAVEKPIDWDYLIKMAPSDVSKCAFGANFHPYLVESPGPFTKVSIYEPENFSSYVDFVTMKQYPSSFHMIESETISY